jgi:hypothetical protein
MGTKLSNQEIDKLLAKKDLPDNLRKDIKEKQKRLSNDKPFNK